jgi:hypothetical protein
VFVPQFATGSVWYLATAARILKQNQEGGSVAMARGQILPDWDTVLPNNCKYLIGNIDRRLCGFKKSGTFRSFHFSPLRK